MRLYKRPDDGVLEITEISHFQDEPRSFTGLVPHPYHKSLFCSLDSLGRIIMFDCRCLLLSPVFMWKGYRNAKIVFNTQAPGRMYIASRERQPELETWQLQQNLHFKYISAQTCDPDFIASFAKEDGSLGVLARITKAASLLSL